jgi:hypothetical protein
MCVYVITRLMNGETSVFGDAFPTRNAAEEAIKIDMEEDNPTCEREDYEIHELKVVSQ